MKTSHYKTPRTLADCEFTVGYPIIERERANSWVYPIVCIALLLIIAWATK